MTNPWTQIHSGSRILSSDCELIESFNRRYEHSPNHLIRGELFPEPFVGNPDAGVYVLGLNPGFSYDDLAWHDKQDFQNALIGNLNHRKSQYPFYFFDPRFAEAPGSEWWTAKARHLLDAVGAEKLANGIFCIELFPYHSIKYRRFPKALVEGAIFPSAVYGAHLLRKAIKEGKVIVAMRSTRAWFAAVPELDGYERFQRLNSPQNVTLSPNNLRDYQSLITQLQA